MTVQQNPTATNEDRYYQALLDRDPAFDGVIFVAVRSTRVYCRPICPSRTPGRARVVFFATPDDAEAAGFRACLRCEPRDPGGTRPQRMVQKVRDYLDGAADEPVTLATLGRRFQISPYHLQRTFKRIIGVTPREYANARRLERLKQGLRQGRSVTHAMYDAGYGSSSRLYENADGNLGMTPGTYGRGGHGMRIAYVLTDCPLGKMLVASTERGICAVNLGDSDEALEESLRHEFPAAELARWGGGPNGLALWLDVLLKHMDGQRPTIDLPVDVQATAFQSRVWQALRTIDYGSTRSYGEIARQIGQPRASRAVARACATNPAAIVIPCHRVIRENGDLGGYGGGVRRQRKLLEIEGAPAPHPDRLTEFEEGAAA